MKLSKKTAAFLASLSRAQLTEVRDGASKLLEEMGAIRRRASLESRLVPAGSSPFEWGVTAAAKKRFAGGFFREQYSTGLWSYRLYAKTAKGVLYFFAQPSDAESGGRGRWIKVA